MVRGERLDGPGEESGDGQFVEAVGEHAVADAGHALAHLAESGGALGESGEDQAVPALAEQGEGAGQGVEVAEGSESWGSWGSV